MDEKQTPDLKTRLNEILAMTESELKEIINDPKRPYFDQKVARALNKGDMRTITSITRQVMGETHAGGRPLKEIVKFKEQFGRKISLAKFIYQDSSQSNNPITVEKLHDLKFAFCIGATTAEACSYADMSEFGYRYWLKNMPEDLRLEWKFLVEQWKRDLVLKARHSVFVEMDDPNMAKWYLERKRRDEFATRTEQELKKVEKFSEVSDDDLDAMIGEITTNDDTKE